LGLSIVLGWGQEGHQITAQLAWNRCSSKTQTALKKLLGTKSLADISPYPDTYGHTTNGLWSDTMHYVNVPKGSQEFNMDDCDKLCVVKAINNYTKILGQNAKKPVACDYTLGVEPCALEFLTHFTGDIHQPLHVSYEEDRGGNSVTVMFYTQRTNLHSCWDTYMIQKWTKVVADAVSLLEAIMAANQSMVNYYETWLDPMDIASESFNYVLNQVYNFTDQDGVAYIGDDYYNMAMPIIHTRLIGGGVRLAKFLNNAFDPDFEYVEGRFEVAETIPAVKEKVEKPTSSYDDAQETVEIRK